jgi:hypothetical protein
VIHVDRVVIRTANGPGGVAGPLRLDLDGTYCHSPMVPYSEGEAKAAFQRSLAHHRRHGW